MNLLFDLGHPAHFHLFKHSIFKMQANGHKVIITVKDQPVLIALLQDAGLDFINLGGKGKSLPGKALRQLWFDWRIWQIARNYQTDIGLGVSMSVPQAALFCKMKSLVFDDDDFAVTPLFYRFAHRFANHIISPDCLSWQQGGNKYVYYKGYHELAYLHPICFKPDPAVLVKAGVKEGETYFILRFNAFEAYHDSGQSGLSLQQKEALIKKLAPYGRVFITGEKASLHQFQSYMISVHPSEMHSFMAYATMFIGDSQTMASESAVLGIPSIRLNSFAGKISYLEEEEKKYHLTFAYHPEDFNHMLIKIDELLALPKLKEEWQYRRNKMLADKIDVTAFFVSLIENYPESIKHDRNNFEC
jgi:predicted glycosyltransferase